MVKYFKVQNYRSIKDAQILSFEATSIGEHEDCNITVEGKNRLLKSILVYGQNGSGKSILLEALVLYKWLVRFSDKQDVDEGIEDIEPFKLDSNTVNEPTLLESSFNVNGKEFRYGFELTSKEIVKEWLLEVRRTVEKPIFLRIGNQYEFDNKYFKDADSLAKHTRDEVLFLTVAAKFNIKVAEDILKWFKGIYTIHGAYDGSYKKLTIELLNQPLYKDLIKKFIKMADIGISDISVSDMPDFEEYTKGLDDDLKRNVKRRYELNNNKLVETIHQQYDTERSISTDITFNFNDESEGTRKLFNIVGLIVHSLCSNKLVIIDELDAKLHPLLTKAIIALFNSGIIKNKSQLLAATHDIALLDLDLLRRDQIYFIEKNKFGASQLKSLVQFKQRSGATIDQKYLNGKFGGIPLIGNLEKMIADVQEEKTRKK